MFLLPVNQEPRDLLNLTIKFEFLTDEAYFGVAFLLAIHSRNFVFDFMYCNALLSVTSTEKTEVSQIHAN